MQNGSLYSHFKYDPFPMTVFQFSFNLTFLDHSFDYYEATITLTAVNAGIIISFIIFSSVFY